MSELVFSCPVTGEKIDPGFDGTDFAESSAVRFIALNVRCPHCGEHHEINIEDAALNAAAKLSRLGAKSAAP